MHFRGNRPIDGKRGRKIGFSRPKRVERFDIGKMGEQHTLQIRCDIPRELGRLDNAILLVVQMGQRVILKGLGKQSFFEKKDQKTFVPWLFRHSTRGANA
jgi:hypothetical protein